MGGLLALFLGASLITLLEILDVILHCVCNRNANAAVGNQNRKSPPRKTGTGNASNHVIFQPVATEALDDNDDVNYSITQHRGGSLNTSNMTGRANVPKIKVNSTTFRGSKQAETHI